MGEKMSSRRKIATVKSKSQPGLKVKRVVSTVKPIKPKRPKRHR